MIYNLFNKFNKYNKQWGLFLTEITRNILHLCIYCSIKRKYDPEQQTPQKRVYKPGMMGLNIIYMIFLVIWVIPDHKSWQILAISHCTESTIDCVVVLDE